MEYTEQNTLAFWEYQRWQIPEQYQEWNILFQNYFEVDVIEQRGCWWIRILFMDLNNIRFFDERILSLN